MRVLAPILLLLLLAPPAQAARFSVGECLRQWASLLPFTLKDPAKNIALTDHQRQLLQEWNARYGGHNSHLPEEAALLAFAELPRAIREELFHQDGKPLTQKQVNRKMGALGLSWFNHPVLREVAELYMGTWKDYDYDRLERRIHQIITAPAAQQAAIRSVLNHRLMISKIVARLRSNRPFEVRIDGKEVVFPDGQRNPLVKKLRDGTLLIEVDYHDMLRTQDYFNGKIFADYVASREGDGVGFEGTFTPDGRLFIMDGHHRTAAYAHRHDGKVLARLRPDSDGKYRTASHQEILQFYQSQWGFSHWNRMSEEELKAALKQAQENPQKYLADAYYSLFRSRRLDTLMCTRSSSVPPAWAQAPLPPLGYNE